MTVVAVYGVNAQVDAEKIFPNATAWLESSHGSIGVSGFDRISQGYAVVGTTPGTSRISVSEKGLVLERGAAWTAPIYYRLDKPVAASHLSPLIERDEVDANRLAAMVGYVVHRDESRTFYRGIRMVRPFERVTLGDQKHDAVSLELPRLEPLPRLSRYELAAELRRRLVVAMERAAGSRRVAVMLSGGLDSSSVLAALLLSRQAKASEISQVTLDFEAPGDDRPHVRALERHYGITVSRVKPCDAPSREAMMLDRAPSRHHGDAWMIACARRAHEMGAELLFTGDGGDCFFGGDLGVAAATSLLRGDLRGMWNSMWARFPHRETARSRTRAVIAAVLRPYLAKLVRRRRARRSQALPDWVGPRWREELLRAMRERVGRRTSHAAQVRYEDALTNPADSEYLSEARAQTDTVSPIPRVDPLYDDDLVQFLIGVPQAALFDGGHYRGLLRLAMKGILPDSVRLRTDKSDFEPALAQAVWPVSDLKHLFSFQALEEMGIIHARPFCDYLAPLYEAPPAAHNAARWMAFWPALTAEAFLRGRR